MLAQKQQSGNNRTNKAYVCILCCLRIAHADSTRRRGTSASRRHTPCSCWLTRIESNRTRKLHISKTANTMSFKQQKSQRKQEPNNKQQAYRAQTRPRRSTRRRPWCRRSRQSTGRNWPCTLRANQQRATVKQKIEQFTNTQCKEGYVCTLARQHRRRFDTDTDLG